MQLAVIKLAIMERVDIKLAIMKLTDIELVDIGKNQKKVMCIENLHSVNLFIKIIMLFYRFD